MILMEINKDLQDYGYKWVGMKEINLDDACKLFGKYNNYSGERGRLYCKNYQTMALTL